MNDNLRKNIQDFLADYQDADFDNWATTDLLLETAANLLKQCVVDDYKVIPQDQEKWQYSKPIVGIDDNGQPIMIDSWNKKENI